MQAHAGGSSRRSAHLARDIEARGRDAQRVVLHVGVIEIEALEKGDGRCRHLWRQRLAQRKGRQHARVEAHDAVLLRGRETGDALGGQTMSGAELYDVRSACLVRLAHALCLHGHARHFIAHVCKQTRHSGIAIELDCSPRLASAR